MQGSVQTLLQNGSEAVIVEAECHISNGLPVIIVVGLGNRAISEAKERIRSAFAACKIPLPAKRITINLAPADIPKDSTSFDLAIATAILQASGQAKHTIGKQEAVIGEIGLDGQARPVRGIIGKLLAGKAKGINVFYVPAANMQQASLVPEINLIAVENLRELFLGLAGTVVLRAQYTRSGSTHPIPDTKSDYRMSDVIGQPAAKRALEIAAAGGHNIFLEGPPGTGKSMLAKALPGIMPPLTRQEVLEITHLHSLANNSYDQLVVERPLRSPHHSASLISLVGGGSVLRPGEISLSHRGILFLDELPEFDRLKIEALRQPLEDRTISISRAKESAIYPANFMLVATGNPCPCGYYGSSRPCSCSAATIMRYRQKISGPILDRIDLFVTVAALDHSRLLLEDPSNEMPDETMRNHVIAARHIQQKRFQSNEATNASITNRQLKLHAHLTTDARSILNRAAESLGISARSYMRTVKVARTIADLSGTADIQAPHITEALQYRNTSFT